MPNAGTIASQIADALDDSVSRLHAAADYMRAHGFPNLAYGVSSHAKAIRALARLVLQDRDVAP